MYRGFIFWIKDHTVQSVIEGSEQFIVESAFSSLINLDDVGLTFDDKYLTITTDTNYINEDTE